MDWLSVLITVLIIGGAVYIRSAESDRRVEAGQAQREAARAAEDKEFDFIMRMRIELERAMNMPVGVHGEQRKPIRKAVGLFSDEAAQENVR
ncbi:MAG: hypothetical protein ACI38A_01855 [Candidatus Ornithomonoglobus sp.]